MRRGDQGQIYYRLQPEVAGGLAPPSRIRRDVVPPAVENPHYVFEGWLGDELLEGFPCFLVTRRLGDALVRLDATGFSLKSIKISKSEQFLDLYSERELPEFLWLEVTGKAGRDDIGLEGDGSLVVTERVLECVHQFAHSNCGIERL